MVKTAAKAAKSNTGKKLRKALKEQAISSAIDLIGDAIQGNNLKDSLKNELKSGRETLGSAIKRMRKQKSEMNNKKIAKQCKVLATKKKKPSFKKISFNKVMSRNKMVVNLDHTKI